MKEEIEIAMATAQRVQHEAEKLSRWYYAADKDALTRRAVALWHYALDAATEALERAQLEAALDPAVSTDDLRAKLSAAGVNIDGILKRASASIDAKRKEGA